METRRGLFKKLGLFSAVAIGLAYYGKVRASNYKSGRHVSQSDALLNSEMKEFDDDYYYPGKPNELGKYERQSQYVGAGSSYSSRKPGDRLTTFKIFDRD